MAYILDLLKYTSNIISAQEIKKVVKSLPNGDDCPKEAYYLELLEQIKSEGLEENERVIDFFEQEIYQLSKKTRGFVYATLNTILDSFISGALKEILMSETNTKPEDAFDGKIFIVDMSVEEYGQTGLLLNIIWKHCFQMAISRSKRVENARPIFTVCDENHAFITASDTKAQATLRSKGHCSISATQNIPLYLTALGSGAKATDLVNALLGATENKIFCRNPDITTNDYARKLFGQVEIKNKMNTELFVEKLIQVFNQMFVLSPKDSQSRYGLEKNKKKDLMEISNADLSLLKNGSINSKFIVEAYGFFSGFFGNQTTKKILFHQKLLKKNKYVRVITTKQKKRN
jgi:hypothetical protein